MNTPKLRRIVGAVAVSALVLAACSSGDDEPTTDETAEATDASTDASTEEATGDATEEMTSDESTEAAGSADEYDWSDVRRRQAVSMAINRQEIVDVIFQGSRAPGDDFWPNTFAGYRGGDFCPNLQYNPEEAAALWEEAGGNAGPVTFWFNSGSGHEEWVEAVANQIQANLGVEEVAFESLPFGEYLDKLDAAEVNGPYRLGWLMDYPSPGNFLGPIHGTMGSSNTTGFSNEAFDEAYRAGDALPLEEAIPDYQAAGDILCEEVPIAPMFFGLLQAVYSENVDNVSFDPFQALNVTEVTDVDGDGAVTVYIQEPQTSLVGQMTNETGGSEVVNGLSAGLFNLDGDSGELVFDSVAESIETEDDQNWTITLNEGWTFHDGTPVTAQSFVDAWNWLAYAPNAANNSYFASVPGFVGYDDVSACGVREATQEDVDAEAAAEVGEELPDCENQPPATDSMSGLTAVDDTTIEVELDAPFAQLPLVLLYNAFDPQPQAFFDASDEGLEALSAYGEAPIGNGPFMFPEGGAWDHNVEVALVAYPEYGGEGPQVDALTYKIYAEDTTAYNDLRSGALDVMDTVPLAEITN
ncbi:MAG TPA: ABC transporter substrate-binding protein, partial [Nitriliruptoraceae bacterium]|nr:ABC transporter substrate-binding protein [Nitriliruptoraceae bacterium]